MGDELGTEIRMTSTSEVASVWSADHHDHDLDEECSPTKSCRNMRDIAFDGYAEPGADLGAAWRAKLESEGKLGTGSIRDLVIGQGD
jgi:hypothetical protein